MAQDRNPLTTDEIHAAFAGAWADRFPPVLTPGQVADLLQVALKTVYGWSSDGTLKAAKFRAGKRVRFVRDRVLTLLFNKK